MSQEPDGGIFTFPTAGFVDGDDVRAQNVNGIEGLGLATWLADLLRAQGFDASPPWAEDHGWDFSVSHDGSRYVCACAIEDEDDESPRTATVVVHEIRSLKQRLRGRGSGADRGPDAVIAAVGAAIPMA